MAELNIDIEKAKRKIMEETNSSYDMACSIAEQFKTYHPALFPVIEAWLNGEEPEFEFEGITLSYIKEKKHSNNYLTTFSTMSLLLKGEFDPDDYKRFKYRWK